MKTNCNITKSQEKTILEINKSKAHGVVFHVYQSGSNRLAVMIRCSNDFEYKMFIGKRGGLYE